VPAPIFPTLKTGAVVQYPATKSYRYSTCVVKFLDGSDQRYRQYTAPLRRWQIRLEMLDESEITSLEQFFLSQQGNFGSFSFPDPWTQTLVPSCSVEQDSLSYKISAESQGAVSLFVVENRT